MSKIITLSSELQARYMEEFRKFLSGARFNEGKFAVQYNFDSGDRKATLYYSRIAWEKQCRLVDDFDVEVAWHGVAERGEDESKDEYFIRDILVYPQTVSSNTVDMDTEKYATWLMANYDDDRFNHIFMQGHSHVRMGTSPSGVDLKHQDEILHQLRPDGFYIFGIWNKSGVSTNKIFDLKKNVMFEDRDITVVAEGKKELDEFIKDAKDLVQRQWSGPSTWNVSQFPSYGAATSSAAQAKPAVSDAKPYKPPVAVATVKDSAPAKPVEGVSDKKRVRLDSAPPLNLDNNSTFNADEEEEEDSVWEGIYGKTNYRDPFYYAE